MGRPKVERVQVHCAACGKEWEMRVTDFARHSTGRVFCSRVCAQRHGVKPVTIPVRPCEVCGTQFKPLQHKTPGRFCSKECHDTAQRSGRIAFTCEICGTDFMRKPSQVKWFGPGRFCSRECYDLGRYKNALDREHNGKPVRLNRDGYVLVWQPGHPNALSNGWVAEHRLVAAEMVGRTLTSEDEVHHINRIKTDNRPENLEVLDGKTHAVISTNQRRSDRELLAAYIDRYGPLDP